MYSRLLELPSRSFFLFGPRGTGKSTWLKTVLPGAVRFDLLNPNLALELSRDPLRISPQLDALSSGTHVVIDEIQKVPALLDIVHSYIEDRHLIFALSGSSARKLKRGGANLLGGRAITLSLFPFCYPEIRSNFEIDTIVEWGTLPVMFSAPPAERRESLRSYLITYLREEIREEGLVRKAEPFFRFLEIAGQLNAQPINSQNISRDARIPRSTVDTYFSILEDTLMGTWLPAYQPGFKVKEQERPKFYWFDTGVARAAAGLLDDPLDGLWRGYALESFIHHEIRAFNLYHSKNRPIFFYRAGESSEIDFVVETKKRSTSQNQHIVLIEVKHSVRWDRRWGSAMESVLKNESVEVDRAIGVYLGSDRLRFDKIEVFPIRDFLEELHGGLIF